MKINKVSFFKRVSAYLIDYFLVTLVITCLGGTAFINKNSDKYTETYNNYISLVSEYSAVSSKLENYFSDEKIEETEYNEFKEKYPNYIKYLDKYYEDGVTKEEYDNLYDDLLKGYNKDLKEYAYNLEKYNIVVEIITIIAITLYFVIFVYFVDGVSLGKKIFGLKIVNTDGSKVLLRALFIRTIFLTNILFSFINLVSVLTLDKNAFYNISSTASIINIILELAIILTVAYRKDNRGLHDLIGGTKVISTKGE